MKKTIILVISMLITILSCSELQELEARRQQRIKERGHGCYRDPYSKSGHIVCGYRR